MNSITSYLDLSQVVRLRLATDNCAADVCRRADENSPGGLPPLDNSTYFTAAQLAEINASVGGMADDGPLPESQMFVTGDTRGNENIELTVLQTLFLDNHNRIAAELQKENPTWTDRATLPEGPQAQHRRVSVDHLQRMDSRTCSGPMRCRHTRATTRTSMPAIANEFSTVAFRFGHSLLSGNVERQGNNGQAVAADVPLAEDFFDPDNSQRPGPAVDDRSGHGTDDDQHRRRAQGRRRRRRSGRRRAGDQRSARRTLQRGRAGRRLRAGFDRAGRATRPRQRHRVVQPGPRVAGTAGRDQLLADHEQREVQQELQEAYGNVNNIDAFEGGLAEDPLPAPTSGRCSRQSW